MGDKIDYEEQYVLFQYRTQEICDKHGAELGRIKLNWIDEELQRRADEIDRLRAALSEIRDMSTGPFNASLITLLKACGFVAGNALDESKQ